MDIALKQRLVGATVLIALAVVVLPMLLGGRQDSGGNESQSIELPPQPSELDFETRRYPLGEEPTQPSSTAADDQTPTLPVPRNNGGGNNDVSPRAESAPAIASTLELESQKPVDAAPEKIQQAQPEPQPEPGPSSTIAETQSPPPSQTPTSAANGRYVVQVGSFGSVNNANRLSKRLANDGFAVISDTVKSNNSTVHRVRVGPYASSADANQAVSRIQTLLGDIKPRVIELSGSSAPASSPSSTADNPLMRWVVQVGSFSSATNAEKLVARLRLQSLSAFQEEVKGSGPAVYRVRVGPFLEKDEALRTEQRIQQDFSIDGVVMSTD